MCTARTFVPLTFFLFSPHNGVMSQETLTRAWEVLQDAYQAQMEGDYDRAAELYQSSLELLPPPKLTPSLAGLTIIKAA